MSQNVAQLKALLFDGEARAIADLSRRIDALADAEKRARAELAAELSKQAAAGDRENLQVTEQRLRELRQLAESHAAELKQQRAEAALQLAERHAETAEHLRRLHAEAAALKSHADAESERARAAEKRLEAVYERAGTADRLESNVAVVIDGALRRAEVDKHHDVSNAMAPFVVRTVRAEIANSRDELVEALYPMTGRIVKAYVASAIRDLIEETNRRLEMNPLMLRLRSLTTGRSVAELALADSQRLKIDELYLIRRGSGELIGRWPDTPATANRDHVLSGILTAINDFASEAFQGEGSALRQIDLEDSRVYLRASPVYLLAVRCTGTAHAAVEHVIDEEFLSAIERYRDTLSAVPPGGHPADTHGSLLAELSRHMTERISDKEANLARPIGGLSPLKVLAAAVLVPLLGWLAWTSLESFQSSRVRAVAQRVIETSTEIKGYPLTVDVEPWGKALTITGLTPTDAAREDVVKRLTDLLPNVQVRDQLSVVPSTADARPQLALVRSELARLQADTNRMAVRRIVDRARLRLEQTLPDLGALRATTDDQGLPAVKAAQSAATEAIGRLRALQQRLGATQGRNTDLLQVREELDAIASALSGVGAGVARLMDGGERLATPAAPAATRTSAPESAEEVAAQAERLSAMTIAVYHANLVNRRPLPAPVTITQAPPQTPRERVETWARANAVFFSNGTDYRNQTRATATLDALATLLKETRVLVRIVGFTDEQGTANQNIQLSMQRAERVVADLVSRGVPTAKLIAIGRGQGYDVSPTKGPQSPNRRVEIQVGFEGEDTE